MNKYFSTITFKDGIPETKYETKLINYLESKKGLDRFVVVAETGAYGKNNHYHVYLEYNKTLRTDSITRSFKNLYEDKTYINRYTVKTLKEKDPIYRLGYYFQKEHDHRVIALRKVNLELYKKEYRSRESISTMLLKSKNHKRYSLNELPSVYLAYCDSHKLDRKDYAENFSEMIRDGIVTFTQSRHIPEMINFIAVLQGETFMLS